MKNGYETMHRLGIEARADMLETVAGFADEERTRASLLYALSEAAYEVHHTENDDADEEAAALRWLACIIERRLDELAA